MQKWTAKWNLREKNWVRSTWIAKSQLWEKSTIKPPEVKWWRQRLTQASDVSNDAIGLTWQNDVSRRVEVHEGAWLDDAACRSAWRNNPDVHWRMEVRGSVSNRIEPLSGAWGRVRFPMASRLPRVCRSAQDDLSGTYRKLIGAIFVAVM